MSKPKVRTAVTNPPVAGTMRARKAFSQWTRNISQRERRTEAISWEAATRSLRASSGGTDLRPRLRVTTLRAFERAEAMQALTARLQMRLQRGHLVRG